MALCRLISVAALLIAFIYTCTGQAVIQNAGESVNVTRGSSAILTCIVSNLGDQTVEWKFVTHDLLILRSGQLLVDTAKYSIYRRQGQSNEWSLQVNQVDNNDVGQYRCTAGTATINSQLYITGEPLPTPPPPDVIERSNFTDCCVQSGVSAQCLSNCFTGSIDFTDISNAPCLNYIVPYLSCASDDRNHLPCCVRRGVPTICLELCANRPPQVLPTELAVCLNHADNMLLCAEEGQVVLPSSPQNPIISAISTSSIYVMWNIPAENADLVQGYRVFYRRDGSEDFRSTPITSETFVMVVNLSELTRYTVYVVAYSAHGPSQPSDMLQTTTLSGTTPGQSYDLNACCEEQGVSTECRQRYCSPGSPFTGSDSFTCYSQIDKLFTCISGQGNHTSCCVRRGVPTECLPLCSGSITDIGFQQTSCFSDDNLQQVSTCFAENAGSVPTSPRNLRMAEVLVTQATVTWDPPAIGDNVTQYLVMYQSYDDNSVKAELEVPGSTHQAYLVSLQAGTRYQVSVSAYNKYGSSLPSPALIFLTYFITGVLPVTTTPAISPTVPLPRNLADCCRESSVSQQCMIFCTYDLESLDVPLELLLACELDLAKAIKCGLDGRNVTDCCEMRDVIPDCLPFCALHNTDTFTFGYEHLVCLPYTGSITSCMESGLALLPSQPQGLVVVNVSSSTISLSWTPPRSLSQNVTGYLVEHQHNMVWSKVNVSGTEYILQNLQPGSPYTVRVLARNSNGLSLPTPEVTAWTLTETQPMLNITAPANVTDCCVRKNVSADCMSGCLPTGGHLSVTQCGPHLTSILQCAADQKNHTGCCARYGLPTQCLGFCNGHPESSDFFTLLCLSFTKPMLACFHEGYANLPSPPVNFHITGYGAEHISVSWEPPEKNGAGATYTLYYKTNEIRQFTAIPNVQSPYNLTGLMPQTQYKMYVVATTEAGSSLPSNNYDVITFVEKKPAIVVETDPKDPPYVINSDLLMSCMADPREGPQDLVFYWQRDTLRVPGPDFLIHSLTASDTGRYTCVATNEAGVRMAHDFLLKITFGLEVNVDQYRVGVVPNVARTAEMRCDFRGYPTAITWARNSVTVHHGDEDQRYSFTRFVDVDQGVVTSRLTIALVQPQDFGLYTCTGTNSLGSKTAHIQLYDSSMNNNTTRPVVPAPAVVNVTACCIRKDVSQQCTPACSYDVDLTQISSLPGNGLHCLADLPSLIQCAADGSDHRGCCRQAEVPDLCLSYCAGVVPQPVDEAHLLCLDHIEDIVGCMENGTAELPGPPQGVSARLDQGYIHVSWKPPIKNLHKVETYTVFYDSVTDHYKNLSVSGRERLVNLKAIQSFTVYNITVAAGNSHGNGPASRSISITTEELAPSAPVRLHWVLVTARSVTLAWHRPLSYAGAVIKYIVHYQTVGSSKSQQVFAPSTSVTVTGLQPQQAYSFHVTAQSSHFISDKSNVVIVNTNSSDSGPTTKKQTGMSDGQKAGVAVGVILLIAIIGLVAILAVMHYFRLKRGKFSRFAEDSVAFENPGFATPAQDGEGKVHGLPDGAHSKDAKMNHSAIMEEVGDSRYVSLQAGDQPSNTSPYATLDVTRPTKTNLQQTEGVLEI